MRPTNVRESTLSLLMSIWDRRPDLSFGQLLYEVTGNMRDIRDMDDTRLREAARLHLRQLRL